jgi:hypothetical protein
MSQQLQQLDTGLQTADRKACAAVASVRLNANYALLLVLVIIPTLSGVALIA